MSFEDKMKEVFELKRQKEQAEEELRKASDQLSDKLRELSEMVDAQFEYEGKWWQVRSRSNKDGRLLYFIVASDRKIGSWRRKTKE